MRTTTLCESLPRAYLQSCHLLSSLTRPLGCFPPPSSCSLSSSLKKRSHFRLGPPRCSGQWPQYANAEEQSLGKIPQIFPSNCHGTVPEYSDNRSSMNLIFTEIQRNSRLTDEINDRMIPKSGECSFGSLEHDVIPNFKISSWLKLALLSGLLTFQGSPDAVASTEFSSGMQSLSFIGDLGDITTGFASAFLLIFFSELGDKTFFIAALLAARNSGAVIFVGTFGALAAMTVISVILGRTFHYVDGILPFRFGDTDLPIDDIAAVCLLVYFGVSTLIEASSGDGLKIKEEQEEAEIVVSELSGNGAGILAAANTVISTFLLVFVAEWGDKSFFSTIALAAASSPLGVIAGALAGHAVATLLAVVGGSLLGTYFSEKVIAYIGGSLFLIFAGVTLIEIVR